MHIDEEPNNLQATGTTWRFHVLNQRHETISCAELLGEPNSTFKYSKKQIHNQFSIRYVEKISMAESETLSSSETLIDTTSENNGYTKSMLSSIGLKSGSAKNSLPLFKPRHTHSMVDEVMASA